MFFLFLHQRPQNRLFTVVVLCRSSKSRGKGRGSLTVSIPRSPSGVPEEEEVYCESLGMLCVGDVVWAKAPLLPAWPGRIMSYRERRGLEKPPQDKVCTCMSNVALVQ